MKRLQILLTNGLAVLALGGVFSSCSDRQALADDPPRPPVASLRLVNHTDLSWRMEFAGAAGSPSCVVDLEPRGTSDLSLASGAYQVRQIWRAKAGGAVETRLASITLHKGQSYRWPLGTLLSAMEPDR